MPERNIEELVLLATFLTDEKMAHYFSGLSGDHGRLWEWIQRTYQTVLTELHRRGTLDTDLISKLKSPVFARLLQEDTILLQPHDAWHWFEQNFEVPQHADIIRHLQALFFRNPANARQAFGSSSWQKKLSELKRLFPALEKYLIA